MNFLERVWNIYDEAKQRISHTFPDEKVVIQNYMIKNMLQTSQGVTKQFEYDGFPLILALFHIVNKSLDLITTEKITDNRKSGLN